MKLLVLATACLLPAAALAQQAAPKPATRSKSAAKTGLVPFSLVADLRYRGGFILASPAGLYRSMADARRGRPAYWLRAGDEVFVPDDQGSQEPLPWLRVARDTYSRSRGPTPGTDTALYYLRATALYSTTQPRQVFTLH